MAKSILIGMPTGSGQIPVETVQSLLQLHKPYPCGFMYVERQRVDKCRNAFAMAALQNGADYLFMVDDDNPIPSDPLEKFIEADKDVMSAPILGRVALPDGSRNMCSFYSKQAKTSAGKLKLYFPITEFKEKGPLHKVDGTGAGCILIKRKVLEALHKKYKDQIFEFGDIRFKEQMIDGKKYDRRTMSEDCEFSERAVDAGFEIWLDDRIRPYHLTGSSAVQWGRVAPSPTGM